MGNKKKKSRIRPLAICVFQHKGSIFVSKGFDSVKQESFYRPLGGRIEFSELAADTIKREIWEEISATVSDLVFLGTLESIFTYEGKSRHEIILVFDGKFNNQEIYQQTNVMGIEDNSKHKKRFDCIWVAVDSIAKGSIPLYPNGLLELLKAEHNEQ